MKRHYFISSVTLLLILISRLVVIFTPHLSQLPTLLAHMHQVQVQISRLGIAGIWFDFIDCQAI